MRVSGKGAAMNKGLFDVENKVWQFLNKMTDLILLSVLSMAFSIPIVTAGAARCGFYYGAMRLHEDLDGGIWSDFWYGFCTSLGKGTVLWMLQLGSTAVLLVNFWIGLHMDSAVAVGLVVLSAVTLLLTCAAFFYAYPIAARYRFGLKKIIRDAVAIALGFLPHSLALLAIFAAGVAAAVYVPYVALFMPAVVGYQIVRVNAWVFRKFEGVEAGRNHDEQTSE